MSSSHQPSYSSDSQDGLEGAATETAPGGPRVPTRRVWLIVAVVFVLVMGLLNVPPLSLFQRLFKGSGYVVLDDETAIAAHPDGLQVSRAAGIVGKVRVKLGSVPREDFVAGTGPDEAIAALEALPAALEALPAALEALPAALEALPAALVPKSPYYTIRVRSRDAVAGRVQVLIPNDAEPWETLDLYTWDSETERWVWLPTRLDRVGKILISDIDQLPDSVLVVQNRSAALRVAATAELRIANGEVVWPRADTVVAGVAEIDVAGSLIGTMGGIAGDTGQLPPAASITATALVPLVRNWVPDRAENWGLVSDMLQVASSRTAHARNLLSLVQNGGYPGLVVDYRSVQPQDRDRFSQFIQELGAALHDQGLWLGVVVDAPRAADAGGWDTGGYDWPALGAAVDQFRFTMPLPPAAYQPGGEAEQLIQWAVTQVPRYKVMPLYTTLSTDGQRLVAFDTVLSAIGEVSVRQSLTETVAPGTDLTFALNQMSVLADPEAQALGIGVGETTYWLGTPVWLHTRVELARRYRLGGVALCNLFDDGNIGGVRASVADFDAEEVDVMEGLPEITWTVTDPDGHKTQTVVPLTSPTYAWTAPDVPGRYRFAATMGWMDKGAVEVQVASPVMTDVLAASDDDDTTGAIQASPDDVIDTGEVTETLKASFVTDVSVPDNTQFDRGEPFTKTWQIKNSGAADWPASTVLAFSEGSQLSALTDIEVGAVAGNEMVDISVAMVAPEEDGTYRSTWALQADDRNIEGGGVYVQIRVGESDSGSETPLPAVAPIASGSFELGGHIMQGFAYADEMRYAGMTWAKEQTRYAAIPDGTIAAAHANGFKIQISALGAASMVSEPGFEDRIADWVAKIAAAGADAIEVWNEPNIDREWQNGYISPQAYTRLLCRAYSAIKAANPGTAVISAAPAPTGYFGGCGPGGCDDQPWMEGLFNAGAARCMDYIGAHHNQGATSPSATSGHPDGVHHSYYFLPQTQLYYNIFRGARQVFYTELGYVSPEGYGPIPQGFGWGAGNTVAEQARWLGEVAQLSSQTGMVSVVIVWNVGAQCYGVCGGVPDPQAGYNIIRPGGGCPACETLHGVLGSR